MPIFDAKSIPAEVHSSAKDPEVAVFLKTGPVLGAHKPIHEQRVEHSAFIDKVKPPIRKIEHLVLDGPYGSLPVRVYHPSKRGLAEGGTLIYVHGGGFIGALSKHPRSDRNREPNEHGVTRHDVPDTAWGLPNQVPSPS